MTKARWIAAIALCAGFTVGVMGQLSGGLQLPWADDSVPGLSNLEQPVKGSSTEAASALPAVDEQAARMTAAQGVLSARAAALKAGSKSAWMDTVDLPGSAFGRRQSTAFDNLTKLPLRGFSYGAVQLAPMLDGERAREAGPRAWAAAVTGTYSLSGFDRAPRTFDATYTLVQRSDGWRIADDTDGATALQLWDLPGMEVIRGRSSIVIGNAPQSRMRDYGEIADSAVRQVSSVWGTGWSSRVVIVTPSTTGEFASLLMRPAGEELDQVAAITQGLIDQGQQAQGDRVVINPRAFTALQPIGRRVVITHELTHVAVRSSTTEPVPIWLSEGLADYIGYSGVDLPRERVASELLTLVRAGKGPVGLPTANDFDPARTTIAPSYSGSWLAVSRLVDLFGQSAVVAFYRGIASGPTAGQGVPPDPGAVAAQAFPKRFGVTEGEFVRGWRRYLDTLAHGG